MTLSTFLPFSALLFLTTMTKILKTPNTQMQKTMLIRQRCLIRQYYSHRYVALRITSLEPAVNKYVYAKSTDGRWNSCRKILRAFYF